jgi:peptidylprolyl isomerase
MSRWVSLAAAVAALVVAGCGSSNDSTTTKKASTAPPSQPAQTQAETQTQTQADTTSSSTTSSSGILVSPTKDLAKKPRIPHQPGDAPSELVKQDIVKGTGATANPGDTVTVQYVGVRFRDGQQFDASWDRGQPFVFPLGAGQVIPGWDQGVVGMKVGGRRQLTIPSDLAYGAQGSPPDIAPNETLIFVVDLKKVQKGG